MPSSFDEDVIERVLLICTFDLFIGDVFLIQVTRRCVEAFGSLFVEQFVDVEVIGIRQRRRVYTDRSATARQRVYHR